MKKEYETTMKKTLSLLALALTVLITFAACGNGEQTGGDGLSGRVSLNGSTSTERVIASLIEAFREEHPGVTLTFDATGSGAGITSATEGTADIGLSSRHLRDGEDGVDAIVFAIDGLAVIVHPDNPVSDLSTEQIAAIYTGAVTNWSEVGGEDAPIAVIGREAGSGSRGAFDDIMGIEDEVRHDQELTSGGAVITAVATNPFAIGYSSLSAVGDTVRVVAVNGIACTEATLLDGSYPVQRPFILMTQLGTAPSEAAQAFIDFVLSPAATEIISDAGVVQMR